MIRVFDVHNHVMLHSSDMGSPEFGERESELENDYGLRTAIMDKWGIEKGAIMPSLKYQRARGQSDTRRVNELVAEYRRRYSDRFPVAMGTVEPLHGVKLGLEELDRIAHDLKLNGVVWHHRYQGTHIAHVSMMPFIKKIEELNLPVFIHVVDESNLESPWELEALASAFPNVTFVAIDALSGSVNFHLMIGICKRLSNVFVETGVLRSVGRFVDHFVRELGSERILFGTDLQLDPPSSTSRLWNVPFPLIEIKESQELSAMDKENIFANNAIRLFKLPT